MAIQSPCLFGGSPKLSVLKRCIPKTLAFAFGLRLRSKTRCFKTRVLGRGLPNGKPQERLRFRTLRSKTLAFKKRIVIIFCDLKTSLGARACVQVLCVQKTRRFAFAFLSPLSSQAFGQNNKEGQGCTIRHENVTYPKKIFSNYFPITVSRFQFLRINFRKLPDTYCICVSCVTLPGWEPCSCRIIFFTVTRFEFFRINWVMLSWQMVTERCGSSC